MKVYQELNGLDEIMTERKLAWYVVHTKPRQELIACENLDRQEYDTYLPLIQNTHRRNGKNITRVESFFPRYLFVRFDKDVDDSSSIRSTRGVVGLVKFNGVPKAIGDDFIISIQANEDENHFQRLEEKTWKPGDTVPISEGPFAGYSCIYKARRGDDRVLVLLSIIGKSTEVTLDNTNLQAPEYA